MLCNKRGFEYLFYNKPFIFLAGFYDLVTFEFFGTPLKFNITMMHRFDYGALKIICLNDDSVLSLA